MNVVWLDMNVQEPRWKASVAVKDLNSFVPGARVTPVFQQSPGVFSALTVDKQGAMNVVWLDISS